MAKPPVLEQLEKLSSEDILEVLITALNQNLKEAELQLQENATDNTPKRKL
ncbi:MAG: hypothetical protein P4M14_00145 [Gammaproteobacteria bacterium]|nr:hypothetical protein [Gammaproteobacteria bacterium]